MSVESTNMMNNAMNNHINKGIQKGKALAGSFKLLPVAMNVGFPALTYMDKRDQGWSKTRSAAYAAGEAALWGVMPGVMMAATTASAIPELTKTGLEVARENRDYMSRMYEANFGGNYIDTHMAGTMRQAGMYSMQQSRNSVQSRLGSEAKSYYRRSRQLG